MWESERCVILLGLVDAFLEALYELLPASVVRRLFVGPAGYCKIPVGDMDENDHGLPGRMLKMSISGYRVRINVSVPSDIDFEIYARYRDAQHCLAQILVRETPLQSVIGRSYNEHSEEDKIQRAGPPACLL